MTDTEARAYRQLWAAVALTVMSELRSRIQAAARGRRSIYVTGSTRVTLGTHEEELAAARTYLASGDFHRICDLAGIRPKVAEAMDYIMNATERFSLKALQERAA